MTLNLADVTFRRPVGHDDAPARLADAHHLRSDALGARREHRAEQAHHDVERRVLIRKAFGVAFVHRDVEALESRASPCLFDEVCRKVQPSGANAPPRRQHCQLARAAPHVQHLTAWRNGEPIEELEGASLEMGRSFP